MMTASARGHTAAEDAADLRTLGAQLLLAEEDVSGLHRPNEFVFAGGSGGRKRNRTSYDREQDANHVLQTEHLRKTRDADALTQCACERNHG